MLQINRSIVQGSGIGPYLYILMEDVIHTLRQNTVMFKFSDDANLFVPANSNFSMKGVSMKGNCVGHVYS